VIFGQGFLPIALDNSISNCRVAVLVLVHPRYFISPVPTISGERSPIHHLGRRPMGDLATSQGRIILRWIFRKLEGVVETGLSWLRIGTGGRALVGTVRDFRVP
jgi:hypothetical protein